MRIVFVGPPGAGKGTQCGRLVTCLGLAHVSTGDLLRQAVTDGSPLGNAAAAYLNAGRLVPDELIVEAVKERLVQPDCADGWLLDGFPRTVAQAEALDAVLKRRDIPLDVVIELVVPEEVLLTRLLARRRDDDREAAIRQRLEDYVARTRPVLEYYDKQRLVHEISGVGTPDEVFDRIWVAVEQAQRSSPSGGV